MDTERHAGPESNNFGSSSWMEMGNMSHSSQNSPTLPDYHALGYVPLDSFHGMSVPPPYSSLPLTVPSNQWPSVIATSPSHFPESGLSNVHLPGISQIASMSGRKASTGGATPRRTLTDEDRRQMCLYHEENKTAKQTDIGAIFGVERSTVSKVLRQKEKYLNADDTTRSPIKKTKGRVPDIEKALSNWARNYQKQGFHLTDAMIREKALFFASTCGNAEKEKVKSSRWLEKFKHKHNLGGVKSRKSSFDSDSLSPRRLSINSGLASAVQSPTVLSPTSPGSFTSPSPLSPRPSHENIRNNLAESLADLAGEYQQQKSNTPPDTNTSSFSGAVSPTSLLSDGPFSPTSQHLSPTDIGTNRPNQAFSFNTVDPSLIAEEQHQPQQPQPAQQPQPTTKCALQDSLSISVLQAPLELPRETKQASNTVKRNRSIPEIRPKPVFPASYSKSATVSPVSPPGSPTQDEARRALELVMNYFQHQPTGLCAQEYVTIGKLMERLDIAKNHSPMLPGGLTRIDEHDDVHAASQLGRKRSVHGYI